MLCPQPSPQPCHCISKNMPVSAFPFVAYTVNFLEISYINQLLCSTGRNLVCLWGHLIFQIICFMRAVSHRYALSVLSYLSLHCVFLGKDPPPVCTAPLASGRLCWIFSGWGCPWLLRKFVELCPDFCNANSSSQTWHFWGKREGVSCGLSCICHDDKFLKKEVGLL